MIDITVLAVTSLTLILLGMGIWRIAAGPPRRRIGQAQRSALLSLAFIPLTLIVGWQISRSRTFQIVGELYPRVDVAEPLVALTFDDGPSRECTDEVLGILREADVHATFFVVGRDLDANLAQGRQIVAAGHELGNHTYSHLLMLGRSTAFVREEIERTDELIRRCGYEGEILFRATYTKRLLQLPLYLARTGRATITFDVEPESYPDVAGDADRIVAHVLEHVRPGSIILLHPMYEGGAAAREALPTIIQGLHARGYRLVTVSELLAAADAC